MPGTPGETRTLDTWGRNPLLYPLSYGSMARAEGIELPTSWSQARCPTAGLHPDVVAVPRYASQPAASLLRAGARPSELPTRFRNLTPKLHKYKKALGCSAPGLFVNYMASVPSRLHTPQTYRSPDDDHRYFRAHDT